MLARRLPTTGRSRPAPGLAASPPTRTHDRPSWSTGGLRHQIQPPACTSVPQIAAMWMTDESHVRKVIHEFNERGMASLDPDYRGGRPRRITDEDRRQVVAVAGARPDSQGVALTRWSLPRLADHLAEQQIVQISPAHLGRVLAEAGLSFQRTRTWKASPDPDFEAKAARVLELTSDPPRDGGAVIAFDQMGPISLRPMAGAGWA